MCKEILNILKDLTLLKQYCKKKTDLLAILQSCKVKEYDEIWHSLHKILEENTNTDKLIYDEENSILLFREENDRQYLLACINFILIYLQHLTNGEKKKKKHIKLDPTFCTIYCKIIEIQFMLSDKDVRMSFGKCLFQICELNLEENEFLEHVKINLLIFLLWKMASSDGKCSDISKLKKYKDFCKYIKWGVSERSTNSFYVLCSYSLNLPKFYENAEGKFFLSHVWSQNESIASHLFNKFVHNTVTLSHDSIIHYSQIIYESWKNCSGKMKEIIEIQIEHLVNLALKCPIKIAARFRSLLNIFHNNKGDKNINNLIFKIYEPVIWRSLMSPNWKLRFNATCIFQLIFPVVDPCIKNINYLSSMEKAYQVLFELAEDGNACVLQAVAKCICYILNELWEMIVEDKRSALMEILINKFLKEKCYDNVKTEVVLGFCEMARNKKINKIFIKIFDRIKYLICDKCLRVRKNFVLLVLELNKNLNENFSNQIDYNELTKRITKDLFTYNIQLCIKKMSYSKHGHHEKMKNKEICEFLKLSTNLITYSMWKSTIKQQAKLCINLLNDYPVLMICISKFATNLELIQRYKLSSVLFEITNLKLREEGNSAFLEKTNTHQTELSTEELVSLPDTNDDTTITEENRKRVKNGSTKWMKEFVQKLSARFPQVHDSKEKLKDPNLNRKYVKYSCLLLCVAYLLKPKNEEEIEICRSEEIENFVKSKFREEYFVDSINTLMQQYYFKILKYVNLNEDNYRVIHKYGQKELNSLYTLNNEHVCAKYIIPLFYKWGLLDSFVSKHMNVLNISIESMLSYTCNNSASGSNTKENCFVHVYNTFQSVTKNSPDTFSLGRVTILEGEVDSNKKDGSLEDKKEKEIYINNEKELNTLIFFSLIVKKKKYHHIILKPFHNIIYNFVLKFNSFLLHIFEKISLNEFQLPLHFISPHYEDKKDETILQYVLYDRNKIRGYMFLYISFFFLLNSSKQNDFSYEWDTLIENTLRSIHFISSIKFKNEIEIVTCEKSTSYHTEYHNNFIEKRTKWKTYINRILHFFIYFLDMIEYTIAMKMILVEDLDFNDLVKNMFMFYKCYELVWVCRMEGKDGCLNEGENESEENEGVREMYLKVWSRISEFLLFILNFDYFAKKTEMKLSILHTFFSFTYEFVRKEDIERVINKYAILVNEKEIFFSFIKNYKKNMSTTSYMKEGQINYIQNILDNILMPKDKTKKGST
ncbi:hypothetical protein, conserved [Plasmodium gonderi]|uniref:Condensin-2 complex subunit G2 n=1 Tax=Plasmodium gonderi TaxID=77519 RepID=A0A1Y1JMB1_PLAGO|nr:hypothetical protein, conserved [Plasmodium gonderi]GAW82605.1 hypothetical protein, conserved [Plasmodium gonderi]